MYKHILIPTDGSPVSRKAIVAGVALAKALGAKVTGFFAAPAPTPVVYQHMMPVGYMTPEQHTKMIERTAETHLNFIKEAAEQAGVKCDLMHITNDFPVDAILAAAKKKKCDLIFMASHGRKGIAGMLLGSVTQKVVTQAPITVVVHR